MLGGACSRGKNTVQGLQKQYGSELYQQKALAAAAPVRWRKRVYTAGCQVCDAGCMGG